MNSMLLTPANFLVILLSTFKKTFQTFAQGAIFSRSLLSIEAVSVGFGPNESKEVSSAKIKKNQIQDIILILFM